MAVMQMGLQMKMSQSLVMTPQLQQAIKLLQLSREDLELLVDQALIENPTLEIAAENSSENEEPSLEIPNDDHFNEDEPWDLFADTQDFCNEQNQLSYDDEWQQYIENGAGVIQETKHQNDAEENNNFFETKLTKTETLLDHLIWQVDMSDFNDLEKEIAYYILGNFNDDGYLIISLREMLSTNSELLILVQKALKKKQLPPQQSSRLHGYDDKYINSSQKKNNRVELATKASNNSMIATSSNETVVKDQECAVLDSVLTRLQKLEPAGVGARSLQECLLLQIKEYHPKNTLMHNIIQHHLALLEKGNLQKISRLEKVALSQVEIAYQALQYLEPNPGRNYQASNSNYVIPDVFVYKRGHEYIISLNQNSLPPLQINQYYATIAKKKETELIKQGKKKRDILNDHNNDLTSQYLNEKIKAGEWLIKSIEQRQKTIYKVTESILKYQHDFFEKGVEYLKPLILKTVAEDIEMHESTVSRITNNKYMHTAQGIFELKDFFSTGIAQKNGEIISSKRIKDQILKLVKAENPKKPLTDQKIGQLLEETLGVTVARRTIAKYRELTNILPSNQRKRIY